MDTATLLSAPASATADDQRRLGQPIHALFSEVARRMPEQTALMSHSGSVTYRELDAQSGAIAGALHRRGVKPGDRIGLYARRSSQTVAAIIGILKTGAAYVPFDPAYPPKLLRYLHEDSSPALTLSQQGLTLGPDGPLDGEMLEIESLLGEAPAELPISVSGNDAAYVMYTSGSTGRPKGVVVPHRGVVRLVVNNPYTRFAEDEVFLQLAPLSFDASTFELWGALLHGGRLAIADPMQPSLDDIAAAIEQFGVTTLWLTAGLFHLMAEHRLEALRPLRQLLAGGDVLSPAHVDKVLRSLPHCRLINGYGPTENTTFTCCYTIRRERAADEPVPIGSPIAHTFIHILDKAMQPVAPGEEGELYAGGAGVALGYLNRPELTAERFIRDPFSEDPQAHLYKTGDRVRQRADGNIEFCGRADRQVKINGKRVELDEIENCLRHCDLVGDAAVVAFEIAAGQRRVAAFVTPAAGADADRFRLEQLQTHLRSELPDYMCPASIAILPALPLSPTGKIDRSRLPLPSSPSDTMDEAVAVPRNATEEALAQIWRQILGLPRIGYEEDFFELGGTSLQLIQAHAMIRDTIRQDIALGDLLRHRSIRALAQWLDGGARDERYAQLPLAPVTSVDRRLSMPEYYHASVGSSRFTLERSREAVFVLRGEGSIAAHRWQRALEEVTAANPGSQLRMRGRLNRARWCSDGAPPRLRILEHCQWDGNSDRGSEFITEEPLSLREGPTVELIVSPQPDNRSLIVLRALHAVFDGGGAVHFLKELFRSLRGEPLLGSNAAFRDVDLMLNAGIAPVRTSPVRTTWLTGDPSGDALGDEFRRIRLASSGSGLLPRVAVAMAAFARRFNDRPVLIAVPIDLRRHVRNLLSTGNFASMLRVPVEAGDRPEDFQRRLNDLLAQGRELAYPPMLERFKCIPLSWLDLLLSRTRWNYRQRKPLETAVISDLGNFDSADFGCSGFRLQDMAALPQPGTAFATLTAVDGKVDLVLNLPKVLASDGRFDAFISHLQLQLR